jgi:uncharacterized protein (DUF1330 family)
MPAYIIVNIEVTNPVPYERYKAMAEATVTAYGGKYIVRGGPAERLEGGWEPKRVVVLEFPDAARARAWWASEDYRPAKELRQACAKSEMIVVTGIGD